MSPEAEQPVQGPKPETPSVVSDEAAAEQESRPKTSIEMATEAASDAKLTEVTIYDHSPDDRTEMFYVPQSSGNVDYMPKIGEGKRQLPDGRVIDVSILGKQITTYDADGQEKDATYVFKFPESNTLKMFDEKHRAELETLHAKADKDLGNEAVEAAAPDALKVPEPFNDPSSNAITREELHRLMNGESDDDDHKYDSMVAGSGDYNEGHSIEDAAIRPRETDEDRLKRERQKDDADAAANARYKRPEMK